MKRLVCLGLILAFLNLTAHARIVYVNNVEGSDTYDGSSPMTLSHSAGPVRSLRRAMQIARTGDTVNLAASGVPYRGGLMLTGGRHSGNATVPFRVRGNGAIISGAEPVATAAWRVHGKGLWSFEPRMKGHYMVLRDGQALQRFDTPATATRPVGLPEGQWAVVGGRAFYQAGPNEDPTGSTFAIAQGHCGISLYGVRYVIIEDVTLQHFRLDGVNAHDLCRNVLLNRVTAISNARSGITVSGSSQVLISECNVSANGESSVRVTGRGTAELRANNLDTDPQVESN